MFPKDNPTHAVQESFIGSVFLSMGGWSWIVLGMILIVIEIFLPSSIVIWFGISALIVGGFGLLFAISIQLQLVIFSALALLMLFTIRRILSKRDYDSDQPNLNRIDASMKGRIVLVTNAIENGVGKVKIGDSVWRAKGPDTPEGARVRIVEIEGSSLVVETVSE